MGINLPYTLPNTQMADWGVRGVEGVGHSACMATIYTYTRARRKTAELPEREKSRWPWAIGILVFKINNDYLLQQLIIIY